ncbi:ABC transporter permease [Streptomyces sp. TRM66268-LWL]|uniref:ABC transporter permease n=1 Tax=Streptomyces polyasparticus TaxID=2767826 RepID=A0ABR7SHJ5_9ACTN|nr:ABC transporter permease [Streptomyces polyasparticus]MBC9714888.1 ABC transporter permease [Streptomyces polyasparticus]
MTTTAVLHSEWIKIRSVRASWGSLLSVLIAALAITLLAFPLIGQAEADNPDYDAIFSAFYAINFAQIAAICFGATAFSSEYAHGALRVSLAAVPNRALFYGAKTAVIGAAALLLGMITSFVTFLVGQAFMGEYAIGLGDEGALSACVGAGIYLALMALFASGLTALLRSGVAVLSLLIPFILIVGFVIGDMSAGVAEYLPDRAGQVILHSDPTGSLGPWTGLGVTALWAAGSVGAGWWAVRRRDA